MCHPAAGASRIFVYGSLLEGFFNYEKALKGKILLNTPAMVKGRLYHQQLKGYPAMLPGNTWIIGELLSISDFERTLALLDEIEGYTGTDIGNEYVRKITDVYSLDGEKLCSAYVYWYGRSDLCTDANPAIELPHGNWRHYMQQCRVSG